jgi:5-methylcytosine-specific restriction endonuclease McrA
MLDDHTLVLNRNWLAIDTCTVRRALCMLYVGAAKAVSAENFEVHDWYSWVSLGPGDGQPQVRAVHFSIRVPEIILLVSYDRLPKKRVVFSRRNLYRRDGFTCQYCGRRSIRSELSIDHVVPRAKGGHSSWSNCVVACLRCNKRKGNRTLEEAGMRLRRDPREPVWGPHLTLNVSQRRGSWKRFVVPGSWNVER